MKTCVRKCRLERLNVFSLFPLLRGRTLVNATSLRHGAAETKTVASSANSGPPRRFPRLRENIARTQPPELFRLLFLGQMRIRMYVCMYARANTRNDLCRSARALLAPHQGSRRKNRTRKKNAYGQREQKKEERKSKRESTTASFILLKKVPAT